MNRRTLFTSSCILMLGTIAASGSHPPPTPPKPFNLREATALIHSMPYSPLLRDRDTQLKSPKRTAVKLPHPSP
jgi:hypothetical protein